MLSGSTSLLVLEQHFLYNNQHYQVRHSSLRGHGQSFPFFRQDCCSRNTAYSAKPGCASSHCYFTTGIEISLFQHKGHRSQSSLPLDFTIWIKYDILSHSKVHSDNQFSNTISEASILYIMHYKGFHIELFKQLSSLLK